MLYKMLLRTPPIVKFCVALLVKLPLNFISRLVPKNKRLILFHGSDLHNFADNSRYLYLYLSKHSDFICIWMTTSINLRNILIQKDFQSCLHGSVLGIFYYFRAGAVIGTGSFYPDFYGSVSSKTKKICLHHGSGPRTTAGMNSYDIIPFLKRSLKWDYFNFTSQFLSTNFGRLGLHLPFNKHVLLGYPRCDHLLAPDCYDSLVSLPLNFPPQALNFRVILYAPTWRPSGVSCPLLNSDHLFDIAEVNLFLQKRNCFLYISLHPKDVLSLDVSQLSNIVMIEKNELYDINNFLPLVDVLITDYSSIATDFLLLNKPVLYHLPDYNDYLNKYGLLEDFRSKLPGFEFVDQMSMFALIEFCLNENQELPALVKANVISYLGRYYCRQPGHSASSFHAFLSDILA